MRSGKFVSYLRVSTDRQGRSGLGLEAQRKAVMDFLSGGQSILAEEYVEVESGKRDDNRPTLAKALAAARLYGARLVIAKLDRLSRDAHFLLGLQKARVQFVAADMPDANEMTVGIMAVVAQAERKMISKRTKEALAAAKARGVKLGGDRGNIAAEARKGAVASVGVRGERAAKRAADLAPLLDDLRASGAVTLRALAAGLNDRCIPAPRGGAWTAAQVRRAVEGAPAR